MFDNSNHLLVILRLLDLVIDAIKVELICDFGGALNIHSLFTSRNFVTYLTWS